MRFAISSGFSTGGGDRGAGFGASSQTTCLFFLDPLNRSDEDRPEAGGNRAGTDAARCDRGLGGERRPVHIGGDRKTLVTGSQVINSSSPPDTGKVECTGANFSGEFSGSSVTSIALVPSYSGCVALGFAATITTNGCNYVIRAAGTIDLECPNGKDIVIDTAFSLCNFTIPSQTGLSSISYANGSVDGKTDITATLDITHTSPTPNPTPSAA